MNIDPYDLDNAGDLESLGMLDEADDLRQCRDRRDQDCRRLDREIDREREMARKARKTQRSRP